MTTQQVTLLLMAAAGVGLFFTGRHFAKKFCSEEEFFFLPATFLTARGIASYVATVISWVGILSAVMLLYIFFSET